MLIKNFVCKDCGNQLVDVSGLGCTGKKLICNNGKCSSHFKHIKCPKCSSTDKDENVIGLGHQQFTCRRCNNKWNNR